MCMCWNTACRGIYCHTIAVNLPLQINTLKCLEEQLSVWIASLNHSLECSWCAAQAAQTRLWHQSQAQTSIDRNVTWPQSDMRAGWSIRMDQHTLYTSSWAFASFHQNRADGYITLIKFIMANQKNQLRFWQYCINCIKKKTWCPLFIPINQGDFFGKQRNTIACNEKY